MPLPHSSCFGLRGGGAEHAAHTTIDSIKTVRGDTDCRLLARSQSFEPLGQGGQQRKFGNPRRTAKGCRLRPTTRSEQQTDPFRGLDLLLSWGACPADG
jgi:hypothetical protein